MKKSLGSQSVTLHVPTDLMTSIEEIADATNRPTNYIMVRAIRTYLLNEGSDIMSAVKGRNQIAMGEFEDIDHLIADVEKIIDAA